MSVKEQLVEQIRGEGYDFISACEIASEILERAKVGERHFPLAGNRGTVVITLS